MKEITVPMFEAEGGALFYTKKECEVHEASKEIMNAFDVFYYHGHYNLDTDDILNILKWKKDAILRYLENVE